ncbi:MAG: wax ester/triacylglycerol synthase family O-acyltransferase, partial [Sinobacteraceae bacterium]|nr:wax ester/triacylglycerol synthase family O-acyltransferase [Nevskiaceae bacterium]
MKPLSPLDTGFLLAERRNQPMHVGGLILMTPPPGVEAAQFARESAARALAHGKAIPPFNQKLVTHNGVWFWNDDDTFDIESHFTHVCLPRPGRIRELLVLISKLHSTTMDRTKPLWEVYLIDGLDDGRVAVYVKIHHSMVDGMAAMKMVSQAMATEPGSKQVPMWALPLDKKQKRAAVKTTPMTTLMHNAGSMVGHAKSAPKVVAELLKSVRARRKDPDHVSVLQAPK